MIKGEILQDSLTETDIIATTVAATGDDKLGTMSALTFYGPYV